MGQWKADDGEEVIAPKWQRTKRNKDLDLVERPIHL
jgi:hypothetical protein